MKGIQFRCEADGFEKNRTAQGQDAAVRFGLHAGTRSGSVPTPSAIEAETSDRSEQIWA